MAYNLQTSKLGVITVFDAKVYKANSKATLVKTWADVLAFYKLNAAAALITDLEKTAAPLTDTFEKVATITTLKMSNLIQSGPELTIQGGVRNNILVKHGKSLRCEMQDALANIDALVAMGGAQLDAQSALTITEKFGGPVLILGDTIMIDQESGAEKKVQIVIYQFLPDSILSINLGADSAATFDLNGEVVSTEILKVGSTLGKVFYSIVDNPS